MFNAQEINDFFRILSFKESVFLHRHTAGRKGLDYKSINNT